MAAAGGVLLVVTIYLSCGQRRQMINWVGHKENMDELDVVFLVTNGVSVGVTR